MRALWVWLCAAVAPLAAQLPEPSTPPPEALAALVRAVVAPDPPLDGFEAVSDMCVALAPPAPSEQRLMIRSPTPHPDSLADLPALAQAALMAGDSGTNGWMRRGLHPQSSCMRDTVSPNNGLWQLLRFRIRVTGKLAGLVWARDAASTSDSTATARVGWWVHGHGIEARCEVVRRRGQWVRPRCKEEWHAQG